MGKVIKKSFRILLVFILVLTAIPTSIWLVIQDSRVQTFLVAKATTILEEKLNTSVSIERIDYRPFNRVLLCDVFVQDFNGDTLLNAKTVSANLMRFSNSRRIISLSKVSLDSAYINLSTDSLGVMNLSAFIQAFKKKEKTDSSSSFNIQIRNASISESTFRMHRENVDTLEYGINFQDLYLTNLNISLRNFSIVADTIGFTINKMSFADKSGFAVDKFRTDMSFTSKFMNFDKLQIRSMGYSVNLPTLHMSYSGWEDMSDFLNQVKLNGSFQSTKASTGLLSYFVPVLRQFDLDFSLNGSFKGTVSDLRVRDMQITTAESTSLNFNANLTGLPDFNNTLVFLDIKELTTTVQDIESIKNKKTGLPMVSLPDNFTSLKRLSYSGTFTGFTTDFVAYGSLTSSIGKLSVDLSIKPKESSRVSFNGQVSTNKFDLGKLLGNEIIGKTSLKATIKGNTDYKKHIEGETDATITSFEANNYIYSNIAISGTFGSKGFIGSLFLDDPNVKLNFMGKVDLSDSLPVFDFSAFVPKLDLVKLNINKVDSISLASFLLTAKITGNNIDNTLGEVKIVNSFYKNQNGEIKTPEIIINANNTPESKLITIKSEFAEGELRGKYNYTNIFSSLQKLAFIYLPALSPDNQKPDITPTGVENPEYNDYIIKLRVKKTRKFTDVLAPTFNIAENTNIFGIYNPDLQSLTLKVSIPELTLSGNIIKNIVIDGNTNDSSFVASITTPNFEIGGTFIRNLSIKAVVSNNNIHTSIAWDNKSKVRNEGQIIADTHVSHKQNFSIFDITINPSIFFLNDTVWNIAESKVLIDSSRIYINNFLLSNNDQSLRISGAIASLATDSIRAEFENIDLSNANLYTSSIGYNISGKMNGYAMLTDLTSTPLFFSDLRMSNINLNSNPIGDITIQSRWLAGDNRLNLSLKNTLNGEQMLSVAGDIYPNTKRLDIDVSIQKLLLNHVEPIIADNVSAIDGYLVGNLSLTGTFGKPLVNGKINLVDGAASIAFTKTKYRVSNPILIQNSDVLFNDFKLYDVNNRIATLNGAIRTGYFKDIRLDLTLSPENFQFLNTTERDNELFYGSVFASGQIRVMGATNNLSVNASVKTEPRTAIFLPLSSSSEVAETDFVNIINRSSDIIFIEDSFERLVDNSKVNVALNLDLQVTPDAEVQIIIDKQLGDIIRANGTGNLKMEINPSTDVFNMFGQYAIESGDYLFTLQGVINKRFKIGQGSTITWNGDIQNANMDIQAIYSLRTNLSPLNPSSESEAFKRRTQVDCQINLTGKLMEPNIDFDIKVPIAETDESLNAVVQDAINTEERLSKQFLSLLVINNFTSDVQDQAGGGFGQGLASTASEMLSNQLSNWLSQWSSAFDVGVNYRPGDELSSDEIELAFSTQLFNDRVTINSNVDMASQNVNNPIVGDFSIDIKIVPSGKLRAKAFARSNNDALMGENQNDYTTGAGLMYREDFNSFRELWKRYLNFFRRKPDEEEIKDVPYYENDTLINGSIKIDLDKNALVDI